MSEEKASGGCSCGKLRYQISQPPKVVAICHCRSCQLAAGAESVGWAVCASSAFPWLTPEPKYFKSSENVTRSFCGDCGTALSYQANADYIDVTLASFDKPEQFPPKNEVWLKHRISWNPANPNLKSFEEAGS